MTLHDCHCAYHRGDLFTAVHLLRHLAKLHPDHTFRFSVHRCYMPELLPLIEDTPNIALCDIEVWGVQPGSVDLWKQADDFWASHPLRNDYAAFTRRYFRRMTRKLGFTDPAPGLLFDFPILGRQPPPMRPFDVLFVNSNPQSAQFLDYVAEDSLEPMAHAMAAKGLRVLTTKPIGGFACTRDTSMTCAQIAQVANQIPQLVGVSTGPTWLCFNKFVRKERYALLMIGNGEHVDLTGDTVNCATIGQAMDELRRVNLI